MSSAVSTASNTSQAVLSLYRSLLRTSRSFEGYNFRAYAVRRTRDGFRVHKDETDPRMIEILLRQAEEQLAVLKRQTAISQMYKFDRVVVETSPKKHVVPS
ncbi:complex 1 protein-domain-containing protein [Lipomyces tetrasporus]|uniref:Complex 1 protein-domain-containing protein n=1 Tax=Lipomyces tetrasporus TaxID=54092 RepID=A0AAD7VPP1_9ASCO|nr:complex 1 protein-domain-containing protein [Lipomyces tetrasporus]KAJ8098002.1 complex 1 protein-domain-containing protein [Lipomyces tetrasporus]